MSVKHETITVSGLVMYCDGCGKSGPEAAYDNHNDIADQAEQMGWQQGDGETKDLCDECVAKQKKLKSKKRSS